MSLTAAETHEVTQLEPAHRKIYVLDTNVLLHDPTAITAFAEHQVVIPMTVLEELDHIKDRRDKSVSREARIAIQLIDKIVGSASPQEIQKGVEIPGSNLDENRLGALAIFPDQLIADDAEVPFLNTNEDHANDNRIINVALRLSADHPGAFVCLVTKDINMRIKAKGSGLEHVEDYRHDRVLDDIDLLSTGYECFAGDFWSSIEQVDTVREENLTLHRIPRSELPDAYPNQFVYDEQDFIAYVDHVDDDYVYLAVDSRDHLMNQRFWGLSPRNLEQAMAMRLLDSEDVDMTVLTGPAGSGKTLLALAAALHQVAEEERYQRVLVSRPVMPLGRDIGFLPGDVEDKLKPWMQPIHDNVDFLLGLNHRSDRRQSGRGIGDLVGQGLLEVEPLTYIRGRSLPNQFIIIDEAQNLTPHEVKTILTRAGDGTKIVLTGDPYQIDHPYVDSVSNGLTYLVEHFKGLPIAATVTLRKGERSELAELASNVL